MRRLYHAIRALTRNSLRHARDSRSKCTAREPDGLSFAGEAWSDQVGLVMSNYELIETQGVPIKAWTRGVGVEDQARAQLENVAKLPVVFRHVAVMPDV